MLRKKIYILLVLICVLFKAPGTFAQVVLEADNSLNNTNKNYLLDFDKVCGKVFGKGTLCFSLELC
jgi:hypothetical protein